VLLVALAAGLFAWLLDPEAMLWTLFAYVAVQQVESIVIVPLIQRRSVSLPPALTIFGVVAAGLLFGFLGLILPLRCSSSGL
jgi:predicted PurR-regulated permease PerM